MAVKRGLVDLDPDYEDVTEQQTKRQRILEEDAKEATRRKIENIINCQFTLEVQNKEDEVSEVDQNLNQSRLVMDRLRACIIANFYSKAGQQKFSQVKQNPNEPPCIHPTVKEYIGKAPKNYTALKETSENGNKSSTTTLNKIKKEPVEPTVIHVCSVKNEKSEKAIVQTTDVVKQETDDGRSSRFKMKKRIVVGNVSKYIPVDRREENDQSTHKWMVYVRGAKDEPRIDHFVKKVWFFLHPSYRPNDLVEVSQPPFHLTRRGWGEFPVRVQLHFKDQRNKRVDIIHQLKLDRTYTGLQTLGSETLVDIELEKEKIEEKINLVSMPTTFDLKSQLKIEKSIGFDDQEKNITIKENQSPLKKVATSLVNGINIKEDVTNNVDKNNILKQNLTKDAAKNVSNSTVNPPTVQILLGGVGSVSNPEYRDSKGINMTSGKGDNSIKSKCQSKLISDKEQNSAVILQGIGSLSTKITANQNQMRIVGGNSSNNSLVVKSCSSSNSVQPAGSIFVVQPKIQTTGNAGISFQSAGLASKTDGQSTPEVVGNHTLFSQPSIQASKSSNLIVRSNVQKSQSNMLLIQTVPTTTRSNVPLQSTGQNPMVINQILTNTKATASPMQQTMKTNLILQTSPSGLLQTSQQSVITQTGKSGPLKSPSKSANAAQALKSSLSVSLPQVANVLQCSQSKTNTPSVQSTSNSQTFYYRCKDAQGNIFLVPQQLLKQVVQSPVNSTSQILSISSSSISTTKSTQILSVQSSNINSNSISSGTPMGNSVPQLSKTVVTPRTIPNLVTKSNPQISSNPTLCASNSSVGSQIFFTPSVQTVVPSTNKITQQSITCSSGLVANSSKVIHNANHTEQKVNSQQIVTNQGKSLLKSAILPGQNVNTTTAKPLKLATSSINCSTSSMNSVVYMSGNSNHHNTTVHTTTGIINTCCVNNSQTSVAKTLVLPTITTPSQSVSTVQKSGNSLMLTMNSSNGKTIVMPTQSVNSNTGLKCGTSLLFSSGQKIGPNSNVIIPNTLIKDNNSNGIKCDNLKQPVPLSTGHLLCPKQTTLVNSTTTISTAVTTCNSVVTTSSTVQGQISSKGQLQVTPQGLKIILNTPLQGSGVTSSKTGSSCSLISKNNEKEKTESRRRFSDISNNTNSLNNFQKPVISSSHPASLLGTKNTGNKTLSLTSRQSSNFNSSNVTSSLNFASGTKGQSSLNSICATLGEKKIVIDLSSELDRNSEIMETEPEKKIICLRKKSEQRHYLSPRAIIEDIKPLRVEDYPDMLSLVRAAVKLHPVVSISANKYQHPYCASSTGEWLSWKVGKRRASEWQRASSCRRYIRNHIKSDNYKGTKLWTTKQIMLWCRLHAFSPHYLESTLHPFGVELTADRIGKKFSSATCPREITTEQTIPGSLSDFCDGEEVDIINIEQERPKIEEKENEEVNVYDNDIVPPSETAVYIQDTCQKIGIKFSPTELDDKVYGSTAEDMIFTVMGLFIGDVITETFASKVSNGRYPESVGMTDVFQALNSMPQADFLTNKHLGVKVTDSKSVHR